MPEIMIIRRLWACVYDLLLLLHVGDGKSLEEIESELDVLEYLCRQYE